MSDIISSSARRYGPKASRTSVNIASSQRIKLRTRTCHDIMFIGWDSNLRIRLEGMEVTELILHCKGTTRQLRERGKEEGAAQVSVALGHAY